MNVLPITGLFAPTSDFRFLSSVEMEQANPYFQAYSLLDYLVERAPRVDRRSPALLNRESIRRIRNVFASGLPGVMLLSISVSGKTSAFLKAAFWGEFTAWLAIRYRPAVWMASNLGLV